MFLYNLFTSVQNLSGVCLQFYMMVQPLFDLFDHGFDKGSHKSAESTFDVQENAASFQQNIKGELQRENKLISYERAFKMLENDMYIAGIGQSRFRVIKR